MASAEAKNEIDRALLAAREKHGDFKGMTEKEVIQAVLGELPKASRDKILGTAKEVLAQFGDTEEALEAMDRMAEELPATDEEGPPPE